MFYKMKFKNKVRGNCLEVYVLLFMFCCLPSNGFQIRDTFKPNSIKSTKFIQKTGFTSTNLETLNSVSQTPSKQPFLSDHSMGCGVQPPTKSARIVSGHKSSFGWWPWMVSVRRTSYFGFSTSHRCGGVILNHQWIATAGHCVDDLLKTQIRLRIGEYDFTNTSEPYPHIKRGIKKKIIHPNYNSFTYENDLALIQVDEPIDFGAHIRPICLPPEDTDDLSDRNATITGWGRLSDH